MHFMGFVRFSELHVNPQEDRELLLWREKKMKRKYQLCQETSGIEAWEKQAKGASGESTIAPCSQNSPMILSWISSTRTGNTIMIEIHRSEFKNLKT